MVSIMVSNGANGCRASTKAVAKKHGDTFSRRTLIRPTGVKSKILRDQTGADWFPPIHSDLRCLPFTRPFLMLELDDVYFKVWNIVLGCFFRGAW